MEKTKFASFFLPSTVTAVQVDLGGQNQVCCTEGREVSAKILHVESVYKLFFCPGQSQRRAACAPLWVDYSGTSKFGAMVLFSSFILPPSIRWPYVGRGSITRVISGGKKAHGMCGDYFSRKRPQKCFEKNGCRRIWGFGHIHDVATWWMVDGHHRNWESIWHVSCHVSICGATMIAAAKIQGGGEEKAGAGAGWVDYSGTNSGTSHTSEDHKTWCCSGSSHREP